MPFTLGAPDHAHLRHEHKYGRSGVEPARRFYFRDQTDTPTGAVAASLAELEAELGRCDRGAAPPLPPARAVRLGRGRLPRPGVAADLAAAEAAVAADSHNAVVEQVRLALIAALQDRRPS